MSYSGSPWFTEALRRRKLRNSPRRRYRGPPSTPRLHWKLEDGNDASAVSGAAPVDRTARGVNLSARKLAAGLWQLRFKEISVGGGRRCDRLSPRIESPSLNHKCVVESTTKNDPKCSKASDDSFFYLCSHQKLKNNRGITVSSVVSVMQEDLVQAKSRIRELESKRRSFRKEVKYLLKKFEEEKILWQRREEVKISVAIDELKEKLKRERKSRRRMEILNTNLVSQLADTKLSEERFMKNYEEERRSRELVEQVCDELVKHIGEEKTEVERLKREFMEVHDELEEERKMLQTAEVWREERVQMKLVDAKVALESKYSQMNKLIRDLETLLSSGSGTLDVKGLEKAELILEAAAKSLNLQDIKEFSYVPPKSNDLFSILKELQECGVEGNEREIGNSFHTSSNHHSEYHSFVEEDERGIDTGNQEDEQGSSYSTEGSNSYHKRIDQRSNGHAGQCSPRTEANEGSISTKKLASKGGEGKLSNGTTTSPPKQIRTEGDQARNQGKWISPGLSNPHITRGMKGCIEWPKVSQKNSSKAKLSEAMIQSQKSQLRHILKQKT
ncbi:hypothetical protein UlMin_011292 [Ulmus minor]